MVELACGAGLGCFAEGKMELKDYGALWDSGVLSVPRERDPWEALQEGLPLLGFARPGVEFLAPSVIEGDSLLAVEEQQELITAFAEVGAGEVWCWAELATATPFLSDTQLASIRAVLERPAELVQTEHGGKSYRFARFISDDAAIALLAEEIPPEDLDRPMGEAYWAH